LSSICFKLLLISLPVFLWFSWQLSLPLNQYTFRVWESVLNQRGLFPGPFYPNTSETMVEVGGLAPYTSKAVPHPVHWTIDQYGNRNTLPLCTDSDVVVLGDSMALGDSQDDPETLASQLSTELGHCVRSVAGGKLGRQAERMIELGLHPHWVVFVIAQYAASDLPELNTYRFPRPDQIGGLESNSIMDQIKVAGNRLRKNMFWNYRASHGLVEAITRSFLAPEKVTSLIAPSPSTPSMIFSSPRDGRYISDEQADHLIAIVDHFATLLKQQNIRLIFSIVPQKEEIYSKLANVPESPFAEQWVRKTANKSFDYVDLFGTLRSSYRENQDLFFHHFDDNHWDKNGVHALVKKLLPLLKEKGN